MIGVGRPYLHLALANLVALLFFSSASCVPDATLRSSDLVIDDMEDPSPGISGSDTYGTWFVYDDGTADAHMAPAPGAPFTMEPIPGGRSASKYAMRMSGAGFSAWGAGMGFNFGSAVVDARAYAGIRFWARVGPATTTHALFSIGAGSCPPGDAGDDAGAMRGPAACAVSYSKNLALTTDWVRYDIGLGELFANPGHLPIPRDQIYNVLFNALPSTTFDLWVDDISWIPTAPKP